MCEVIFIRGQDWQEGSLGAVAPCHCLASYTCLLYLCTVCGFRSVEAVWVGLRQRQSSGPLQWTNENRIPYSMHYSGKILSGDTL